MNDHKQPNISDTKPKLVDLEIGKTYKFCTCGESTNQPFCNGTHKGSVFSPLTFTAEKNQAKLCMCKHTNTPPYCDGTHRGLTVPESKT